MRKAVYNILPATENILETMGEQNKVSKIKTGFVC